MKLFALLLFALLCACGTPPACDYEIAPGTDAIAQLDELPNPGELLAPEVQQLYEIQQPAADFGTLADSGGGPLLDTSAPMPATLVTSAIFRRGPRIAPTPSDLEVTEGHLRAAQFPKAGPEDLSGALHLGSTLSNDQQHLHVLLI